VRSAARLGELVERDPAVAALARLLALAFGAAAESAWAEMVPDLPPERLRDGRPLLHGATVAVDAERLGRLLVELEAAAGHPAGEGPGGEAGRPTGGADGALTRSLSRRERGRGGGRLVQVQVGPSLALLEATIAQASERIGELAEEAGVDADRLATLGHALALPLLQAVGRRAEPRLEGSGWEAGYCPVCAAWPTLAELRGLERERWLRCGRCGAGWRFRQLGCPYCGENDHRRLGYLAPRDDRESRRAEHCDSCHGYVKALTVLGPIRAGDLAAEDLATVELDLAAVERGYGRPAAPGFPLALRVAARPAGRRWLAWRR
jgi:FdhE protein